MFASLARYRALRIGTFPFAYRGLIPTRGTRNHHFASAPFPCFSAVELARWLVQTRRFQKAAFVFLEHLGETHAVLDSIGRQLLPKFSVAEHGEDKAWQLVEREIKDCCPLVLLDNCESLLPDQDGKPPLAAIDLPEFLAFCTKLQQAGAKLLFTSREALPPPFAKYRPLGALSESEAIAILKQVLELQGLALPSDVGDEKQAKLDALKTFVNHLNCHARVLVLVAPISAQKGFKASNKNLALILAELHDAHPDNRELSLYASLELSLRRLSAQHREWVKALAVFHGGFQFDVLARVLEIDTNDSNGLAAALVQVGLAEFKNYGHFAIDPALSAYLKTQLTDVDYARLQQRWIDAISALVDYLYEQRFQDVHLAAKLTILELQNFLVLLNELSKKEDAEQTFNIAGRIEKLLQNLNQPKALALSVKTRQLAAGTIGVWNYRQFENQHLNIERLLQQNELQRALNQAEDLLHHALQAGETAYQGAAYDISIAYYLLGDVLRRGNLSEEALKPLQQAQQRFQTLADADNQSAALMASKTLAVQADCLAAIGQLEAATKLYLQGIERSEKLNDKRQVAVARGQLASVRTVQKDYPAALTSYAEARELFQQLNEPECLATLWHQTGIVYRGMQDFEAAECYYRKSLNIDNQQGNQAGTASTLWN